MKRRNLALVLSVLAAATLAAPAFAQSNDVDKIVEAQRTLAGNQKARPSGANPKVADATKTVNRGFSFRIDDGGTAETEFVMVNAPLNFVKSPEQMLAFLQARLPGADGRPGDEMTNATQQWPDEDQRPTTRLGRLAITALENNETCDARIFDPLFTARQPAYAISTSQRN